MHSGNSQLVDYKFTEVLFEKREIKVGVGDENLIREK